MISVKGGGRLPFATLLQIRLVQEIKDTQTWSIRQFRISLEAFVCREDGRFRKSKQGVIGSTGLDDSFTMTQFLKEYLLW
jgi:hypothetical protein